MIASIQAVYPPKGDAPCISVHTDAVFHIYDPPLPEPSEDEQPQRRQSCTRRIGEPQVTDLEVNNPQAQQIHLVAIDSCLYDSGDTQRCDCALVCAQEIRFVEFKHGNHRRRTERIKDCIPQLAATINDFYKAGLIAPKSEILAIACVGFQEEFPPRNASIEARVLQINSLVEGGIVVDLKVTDSTTFGVAPSDAATDGTF
jgi:hypothetical protein